MRPITIGLLLFAAFWIVVLLSTPEPNGWVP